MRTKEPFSRACQAITNPLQHCQTDQTSDATYILQQVPKLLLRQTMRKVEFDPSFELPKRIAQATQKNEASPTQMANLPDL